jgi:hypothetical protein
LRRVAGPAWRNLVSLQQLDQRGNVQVVQGQHIGGAVEQGRGPIFQQGRHFGVQRAQNDQTALNAIGIRRKLVDFRL